MEKSLTLTRLKTDLDDQEGDKPTENENEYVIHSNTNESNTENNQDTLEEVVYECPDKKTPDMREDFVNEELEGRK